MQEQQLVVLVEPILEETGLELDGLEVIPIGKRRLLRITVDGDGPYGRGPLLDDISTASARISAALDASNAVGNTPYTLEVTSRGVGKPLTEAKHYRRNRGRRGRRRGRSNRRAATSDRRRAGPRDRPTPHRRRCGHRRCRSGAPRHF